MSKAGRLLAVYARFAETIAAIPDLRARELHELALGVPGFVEGVRQQNPGLSTAQVADGLEQALDEMPDLMADVSPDWRWAISRAWHEALVTEYPEFLDAEAERVSQLRSRGTIRTEAEFHLVRHRIDVLEAEPELGEELRALYALRASYGASA